MERLINELRGDGCAEFVLACLRSAEPDAETLEALERVYREEVDDNVHRQHAPEHLESTYRQDKPISWLKVEHLRQLLIAFLDAFDYASLKRVITIEPDKSLEEISLRESMIDMVGDLLTLAMRQGWIENLLTVARRASTNSRLHSAVDDAFSAIRAGLDHRLVETGKELTQNLESDVEGHVFPISEAISATVWIDNNKYLAWCQTSVENPEEFWGKHGKRID